MSPLGSESAAHLTNDLFELTIGPYLDYCTKLGIIVDFDGTISPLAATPALAFIPHETKKVLERMSHMVDVNIVIISGRDVDDLKQKVSYEVRLG
jgi:trehalose-6-phosphatase